MPVQKIEPGSLVLLHHIDKKNCHTTGMSFESDHSHMCEYCSERFSCPLEKHECRIDWKTGHNDHYPAMTCYAVSAT